MKKKVLLIGGIIAMFIIAMVAFQGMDTSRLVGDINGANNDTIVYKTKTGDCFHVSGCRCLSRSCIEITYGEAKAEGLEPCSKCGAYRWVNY